MDRYFLVERVEILEQTVSNLAALPARVAAVGQQVSQLRDEVRVEFSAVRAEMGQQIQGSEERLRVEMRSLNEETRREMQRLNEQTRHEMAALNAETGAQMRVLHEDVIGRIATLGEAPRRQNRPPRAGTRPSRSRKK